MKDKQKKQKKKTVICKNVGTAGQMKCCQLMTISARSPQGTQVITVFKMLSIYLFVCPKVIAHVFF